MFTAVNKEMLHRCCFLSATCCQWVNLRSHSARLICIDYRKYAAANISTNLYVVSEPWLYSLAWCAGAHSVATNAVHILKKLQRPLFLMVNDTHLQFSGIFASFRWSFSLWLSSLSLPDARWVQAYVESNRHHFPYSCRDYLCVSLVSLNTEFTTSHRDSEITLYSIDDTM